MSWRDMTQKYRALCDAVPGSDESESAWSDFQALVHTTTAKPPYHISLLFDRMETFRGARPREEIAVLDHGCGSALTLFYLAVLGYTNFWGVDIGGDFATRNAIAASKFAHSEERLSVYDGAVLPISEETIDVVFSQQVLEHVREAKLELYYSEEARVLKSGGLAVHYVPHRLVPYDSHTKTWLIHYLPGPIYRRVAALLGSPIPEYLILRWPWTHKALLRRHIGSVDDITAARFANPPDADNYDGSLRLRNSLAMAMTAPLAGPLARSILANFVMLETLSHRRDRV